MSLNDTKITQQSGKKLLDIANEYLLTHNQIGSQRRLVVNQLAVAAYRALNLTVLGGENLRVKYLPISAAGTVAMPSDYISYSKVAFQVKNQFWTLTVNRELLPPRRSLDECGLPIQTVIPGGSDSFNSGWYFSSHYDKNGTFIGKLYGLGGGFNSKGYFKEDLQNRRFILDGVPASEIVLEYKSSGIDINAVAPTYTIEGIIAFIRWRMEVAKPVPSRGLMSDFEGMYAAQLEFIQQYTNPFHPEEYYDSFYSTNTPSVKR